MPDRALEVIVYTRQGCHLCDAAIQLLRSRGLSPRTIDIDVHPEFREMYDHCVPVVTIGGKLRFRGHVNEVLLSRLLEQQ